MTLARIASRTASRVAPSLAARLASRLADAAFAAGWGVALGLVLPAEAAGVHATPPAAVQAAAPKEAPALLDARVLQVYDGDSLLVRGAGQRPYGVRLAGIDAPERAQPHADLSRRALQALLHGRDVRIEPLKVDLYGRTVGRVFVAGRDAGMAQLRAGLAWHFARYDADLPPRVARRYARAERQARLQRIGLWRDEAPLPPWEYRARMRGVTDTGAGAAFRRARPRRRPTRSGWPPARPSGCAPAHRSARA